MRGLSASHNTQRDRDNFDDFCEHLIIRDTQNGQLIGTYRLQTWEKASTGHGFYSNEEFDLSLLGKEVLQHSVELGRACILSEYRHSRVLSLLWRGIAAYLLLNSKNFVFGCCSLSSQDPIEAYRLYYYLFRRGYVDINRSVLPRAAYYLTDPGNSQGEPAGIPPLMQMYLRYGAKILSLPAIDRDFGTIDYFMFLDVEQTPNPLLRQIMETVSVSTCT